ncbi:HNH endonuclease signature motif containing protein [Sphingobium yanoikuyae]|uniref:HNH endonuclease signature motif containing protein n=1 Tax=Sphingobium yanoikuyae TaxID=13690 RepID=UPI003B9067DD
MKQIPLKGGLFALVDDEDYEKVAAYKWTALRAKRSRTVYARTTVSGKTAYMHRIITGAPDGMTVDHVDGDGLNNRRSNLAICTQKENMQAYVDRSAYDRWKASEEFWGQFGCKTSVN